MTQIPLERIEEQVIHLMPKFSKTGQALPAPTIIFPNSKYVSNNRVSCYASVRDTWAHRMQPPGLSLQLVREEPASLLLQGIYMHNKVLAQQSQRDNCLPGPKCQILDDTARSMFAMLQSL